MSSTNIAIKLTSNDEKLKIAEEFFAGFSQKNWALLSSVTDDDLDEIGEDVFKFLNGIYFS